MRMSVVRDLQNHFAARGCREVCHFLAAVSRGASPEQIRDLLGMPFDTQRAVLREVARLRREGHVS